MCWLFISKERKVFGMNRWKLVIPRSLRITLPMQLMQTSTKLFQRLRILRSVRQQLIRRVKNKRQMHDQLLPMNCQIFQVTKSSLSELLFGGVNIQ